MESISFRIWKTKLSRLPEPKPYPRAFIDHMRFFIVLPILLLVACQRPASPDASIDIEVEVAPALNEIVDPLSSLMRINSTTQGWNPGQPWEKQPPLKRRSLGALVAPGLLITTAEMAADATYLELESIDGKRLAAAKVEAVDYEANLALIAIADPEQSETFFEGTDILELAEPPTIGTMLDIVQVEENGTILVTSGPIQRIDVVSNFLSSQYFLTYEVKASMQSAASSYSLPALHDGKFAGLLTSYDSKDQLSDITATEIIQRFIEDAQDGDYVGFPSLGVSITSTDDPNFRAWLQLPQELGGLYVSKVRPRSSATDAGLLEGDVITEVDGYAIDRLGYFEHEHYGRLYWSHLVRGTKKVGDTTTIKVQREGQAVELSASLERRDLRNELVPAYSFDSPPNFLVKGGMVFQELTMSLLEAFGDDWKSRAPLNLLNVIENSEEYQDSVDHVVFLAGVIATPATVGYEPLRNLIVTHVNGNPVRNMRGLIEAFDKVPADGLHAIEFEDEEIKVYLDELMATQVDTQLLNTGLSKLSRAEQ